MKKILFTFFPLLLIILLFPSTVSADELFSVTSDIAYTVSDNGNTHVAVNASLTNTSSQSYATSYKLKFGFENITNMEASDAGGKITPYVTKSDDGNIIELYFNNSVVGLGKVLNFSLSFDTTDIAKNRGRIWEINIPGIHSKNDFTSFNVHVKVPESFGQPTYIKPFTLFTKNQLRSLDFTKEQLQGSGISIAYGEKQVFEFTLLYHLKNSNLVPVKTEIAIPPSTNYQNVFIESMDPKPDNVTEDKDGNWLAQYILLSSERKNIVVKGKAELLLYPKRQPQTESELKEYVKEKTYWEAGDEKIKKLASALKTPAAIYEYTVKNLTYDFSRVTSGKPRLGAAKALADSSSAVCLEYADLFVAIARAAGIPARVVEGYAYTDNVKQRPLSLIKDVLHAWPEYYDRELQAWIMIDPTWGNTTGGVDYFNVLDFDHLAFVIKGMDSNYPVPAGGYKSKGYENSKDVNVNFTANIKDSIQKVEIITDIDDSIVSGIPITGSIRIKNVGDSVFESQLLKVISSFLTPRKQILTSKRIPPFGYANTPLRFDKTPILTNKTDTITIAINGKTIYQRVQIRPFFLNKQSIIIGGLGVAAIFTIIISIFAIKARSLSVRRQREQSLVRGQSEKPQK